MAWLVAVRLAPARRLPCAMIGLARQRQGQRAAAAQLQNGFAAVAAIFLIVILAALGGFMLTFSNTQQLTAVQDLQGTRAFWAARAGLEWGVAQAAGASCAASTTLPGGGATFDGGFDVTVECHGPAAYTEGSATVNIYTVTSTAKTSGGTVGSIGYVERSMTAGVER